jgi:hypothetical protein
MDSVIDQFFAAWSAPDLDARIGLIEGAMAPNVSYADPRTPVPLAGTEAIVEYVSGFVTSAPGATATAVDRQIQSGCARATIEFKMADGHIQYGQYFVEFADDGRICRMIGFVGTGAP